MRVIISRLGLNGQIFIGSRNNILYSSEDGGTYFSSDMRDVVDTLIEFAEYANKTIYGNKMTYPMYVFYVEVFGGKINNSKNYTTNKRIFYRVFSVAVLMEKAFGYFIDGTLCGDEFDEWLMNEGVVFLGYGDVIDYCNHLDVAYAPVVTVFENDGKRIPLPDTVFKAYEFFLKGNERCAVSGVDGVGLSEGVVLHDSQAHKRAHLQRVKLKFKDYKLTLDVIDNGDGEVSVLQ